MTKTSLDPLPRLRGRVRVGVSSRDNMRGGPPIRDNARNLRRNLTDAEQMLWRELRRTSLGWRFRCQFPIPPYIVDFACIEARLIIEVDGGQHSYPGDHDRRDAVLGRKGWRILRFWNNDVLQNRTGVLQTISDVLVRPPIYPHPNPPPQAGEGVLAATRSTESPPPQAGRVRVGA
jgi:very-short-patch-repair endonuclease